MTNERWDGDEGGSGVSSGEAFTTVIAALLDEMRRPDWNTEQPEAHLLPHLRRTTEQSGSPWRLRSTSVDEDHVFVVDLEHADARASDLRSDVFSLIATVAEPTTLIVQRREGDTDVFDVTLAIVPGQAPFPKGHGHLLRLRVNAPSRS